MRYRYDLFLQVSSLTIAQEYAANRRPRICVKRCFQILIARAGLCDLQLDIENIVLQLDDRTYQVSLKRFHKNSLK